MASVINFLKHKSATGQENQQADPGPELFLIYARNHNVSIFYYVITSLIFLCARLYFYGNPGTNFYLVALAVLVFSTIVLKVQQLIYSRHIRTGVPDPDETRHTVFKIAALKPFYMIPWLLLLFWPLQASYIYEHLLGYFFILCALAISISSSASYLPLFLWDVIICFLFGLFVVKLNLNVQETPYIGAFLTIFTAYTVFLGQKMNTTAIEVARQKMAVQDAAEKSALASKAKTDFLAFMSHETRTPMAGILGMVRFLKDTPLTQEQKEYIDAISGCSSTLLNTLNDALDLTRIEAGKLQIKKQAFDLHSLLKNSVSMVSGMAREKNLPVLLKMEEGLPQFIYGDPNRLQQIMLNLLNNAIKFTPEGSITLTAAFIPSDNLLRIAIVDTGIGISEENQVRLFQKFSQVHESFSGEQTGFGLGLAISRDLVHLMEGKIGLSSQEDAGTEVWFEIPYEAASPTSEKTNARSDTPSQPLKILLVDDNRVNRMIAVKFLESHGHIVLVAETGKQAVETAQKSLPDMILMDLNLPDMDGIAATKAIRELGKAYAEAPVLALTANISSETLEKCKTVNIIDYLLKPYEAEDLFSIIYRHIDDKKEKSSKKKSKPPVENRKIKSVIDTFGFEYAQLFVKSGIEETERLAKELDTAGKNDSRKNIIDFSHDLKSVSGSLGMDKVSDLAGQLEIQAKAIDYPALTKFIADIIEETAEDLKELDKYLASVNPDGI